MTTHRWEILIRKGDCQSEHFKALNTLQENRQTSGQERSSCCTLQGAYMEDWAPEDLGQVVKSVRKIFGPLDLSTNVCYQIIRNFHENMSTAKMFPFPCKYYI